MIKHKYLFIGAHPDDIEINAGGTIAELAYKGREVATVVCSYTPLSLRGEESLQALERLGVPREKAYFLGLDEPNMHEHLPAMIAGLERIVKNFKPDVVVTHFHGDTHQDHETVNKATMVAARFVPNLYMYVPTYPSGRTNIPATPNLVSFFSDGSMRAKVDALAMFATQKVKYGCEEWLKSVESIARGDAWRYGGKHGCAELFQVSRAVMF